MKFRIKFFLSWMIVFSTCSSCSSFSPEIWVKSFSLENDWHISSESFSPSFREYKSILKLKDFLSKKRIVFIGDSLTRYQYLNFIHILHFNAWTLSVYPRIEIESDWPNWKSFHIGTSFRFGCREICDCYRDRHFSGLGPSSKENRFYYDPSFDISVFFFAWFPPIPIMLNPVPKPNDFKKLCREIPSKQEMMLAYNPESEFVYSEITDFINDIIKPMMPDVLILNQGFWKNNKFRSNETYFHHVMTAAKSASKRFIWKTSTSRCFDAPDDGVDGGSFRTRLIEAKVEVFDAFRITHFIANRHNKSNEAQWTCLFDKHHFQPFVYREINKKFVDLLVKAPVNYNG